MRKTQSSYAKKISIPRKNIIKIYRLIWGQRSTAIHVELEGDKEFITKLTTYKCLWLITKVKIFTSGIDNTSNGYYSVVMAMRTIFYLRQGRYEPTEAYYRLFEAAISTAELENFNATTNIEINKAYADGDDKYGTKRFQAMRLIMYAYLDQ